MDPALFYRFCDLAYSCAGIRLGTGKEALVAARVAKRMRALSIATHEEYLDFLEANRSEELVHFLDSISTNFTSFFRERDHFDALTSLVEERLAAGASRLRFWSAASSTGEEPYSMAIAITEIIGDRDIDWRILATDIATTVLRRARDGIYSEDALAPLGSTLTKRYLHPHGRDRFGTRQYQVSGCLKSRVVFKRLNLATPPFPMRGPLDMVFCRNVMIYFDHPVRQPLIQSIEALLSEAGLLVIGHSETLTGIRTEL